MTGEGVVWAASAVGQAATAIAMAHIGYHAAAACFAVAAGLSAVVAVIWGRR